MFAIFDAGWEASKAKRREARTGDKGGPNYYLVRRNYLGRPLIDRTREMWQAGDLTTTRAAMVLGVRSTSVHTLLDTT